MSRTAQVTGWLLLVVVIAMILGGWRLYVQSAQHDTPGSLGQQLIQALDRKQSPRARELLDKGADVTAREQYSGRTCLMAAAATGDEEMLKRLIQRDASVDATDSSGGTAFDYLFVYHHANYRLAKLLVPKPAAIRRKSYGTVSTLEAAINSHDAAIVGLVLDAGANPNQTDMGLKPLLITAAEADDLPAVKQLVNHGASVNARGQLQEHALATAIHLADDAMAQYLIAHGADVNVVDSDKVPVLVAAASGNLPNTVTALLAKGAKVDALNSLGETALIVATREGRRDIVETLLKKGADTKVKDKTNRTARDWAKEQGFADIERILAAH